MKRILINIIALLIFIAVFIGLALVIIHVLALGVVIGLVLFVGFWVKSKLFPHHNHNHKQQNIFIRDFYMKTAVSRSGSGDQYSGNSDVELKSSSSGRIIDVESEKDK